MTAQSGPEFKLGFKALADQIPAVVGDPLEDEHWGANGDSLQQTSTGLMAWRKADNWTAFTNGSRTWINGPVGVQDRTNDQRFEWEGGSASSATPASDQGPGPTASEQQQSQARETQLRQSRLEQVAAQERQRAFRPTDILMFDFPDWGKLDVAARAHATIVGSAHQTNDPRQENYSDPSDSRLKYATQIAHRAGLRYMARISSDLSEPPEVLRSYNAWAVDIDNKPIFQPMDPPGRPWNSIFHPAFRQRVIDLAREIVDGDADIVNIDTWTLQRDVIYRGGDFSEYSMKAFREYLRLRYTPEVLRSLGIGDIDSFDYGDFIRKGYLSSYRANKPSVPLYHDFEDFLLQASKEFWSELIDTVKAYARQKGKSMPFTVNVPISENLGWYDLMVSGLPLQDKVDGFTSEYDYGAPASSRAATVYNLARSLGKPLSLQPNGGTSAELLSRPDVANLMKLYTAEAYASGGFTCVPHTDIVAGPRAWTLYSADLQAMSPYYDFISGHKQYYEGLASAARTAVLYSYATARQDERSNDSFFGISRLLLDAHYQYDVLFAGDNRWIEDKLSPDSPGQLDLVILPGTRNLSDRQVDLILDYIRRGGTILAFGDVGSQNERGGSRTGGDLGAMLLEGSHPYGQGHVVYVKSDLGAGYRSDRGEGVLGRVAGIMKTLVPAETQTNASRQVGLFTYWDAQGSTLLHLVNYDYDPTRQGFNRQTGIDVEVPLSSGLQGKDLAVFYSSPDGSGVQELKYGLAENSIRFQVPGLDTYGVLFVGERGVFPDKVSR
ncbi:MAG: hypothetical protein ACYC3V_10960 [Chloroflexota bacterium]